MGTGPNSGSCWCAARTALRAFANVCRHRGHELVPAVRRANGIVCPYHGWNYRARRSLRNAPGGFRDVEGFDKSQFGLVELTSWSGTAGCSSTRAARAGRSSSTRRAGAGRRELPPEDLVTVAPHSYELETNWKIIVENYQECYHCPSIHPELCRVSPPQSGENLEPDGEWMGGWMDLMRRRRDHVARRQQRRRRDPRADRRRDAHGDVRRGVPQPAISLHPDYVMTHTLRRSPPDRTYVECSWAFPREVAERPGFDPSYAVDFWDLTNRQDWAACESVQRGLDLPARLPGPAGARRGRGLPVRQPGG